MGLCEPGKQGGCLMRCGVTLFEPIYDDFGELMPGVLVLDEGQEGGVGG